MRIKQSVCYPMVKPDSMPLEAVCTAAKEIGYKAIEMWGREDDFEEAMALAKRYGLAVATMVGHKSLKEGLADRANHERIEGELVESIDIAAKHGIPGLICLSGNRLPGISDEEAIDICADGLRRVVKHAEKKKVNLNLELLNSKIENLLIAPSS